MPNEKSRDYEPPELRRFSSAEEVWAHYNAKGTLEERVRLKHMLGLAGRLKEPTNVGQIAECDLTTQQMPAEFAALGDQPVATVRLVSLSVKDAEEAARLLKLLTEATEAVLLRATAPAEPGHIVTSQTLIRAAREELRNRRRRTQLFDDGMFGEPGWEILLHLYIEQHGPRFHIGRLTKHLGLPETTTIRWINILHEQELIQRRANPTDQRAIMVELTARGIQALDSYFSETVSQTP